MVKFSVINENGVTIYTSENLIFAAEKCLTENEARVSVGYDGGCKLVAVQGAHMFNVDPYEI